MSTKFAVAGLQLKKEPGDWIINFNKLQQVATSTIKKYPWVELIFTGELYLQQYGEKDWKDLAQPFPSEITIELSKLAKKLKRWLIPGSLLEKTNKGIYNTIPIFNPQGELVTSYRKLFPWLPQEDTKQGTEFCIFEIPGKTTIGVMNCYDVWFPEVCRTLCWMGAEVILHPSAAYTPDRNENEEILLCRANAIMNQCYFMDSNIISSQGGGGSIFVDPEGRVLQTAGTNEMVMTEILDIDQVRWVRENGQRGLSPLWKSLRNFPGNFPIYQDIKKGNIFKNLSEMKIVEKF